MTTLWIRADAEARIGIGHVMRCLALAEAARSGGGHVRFATLAGSVGHELVTGRGFDALDVASTNDRSWLEHVRTGDVVFFDGYDLDISLYEAARRRGARVGAMDDFAEGAFPVDVLVNQNPVRAHDYRIGPQTRLLLGPGFALVRDEFVQRRHLRQGPLRRLLVSFGGSDIAGATGLAVAAVRSAAPALDVTVLRGPAAPATDAGVRTISNPSDVATVFDEHDAALIAAGSTTWELLCMGLPVLLVQIAANQGLVGPAVADAGAGIFLGGPQELPRTAGPGLAQLETPATYRTMSQRACHLVDGRGASRVLDALWMHP